MAERVPLHLREYGRPRAGRPPLLFLHGLFGAGVNWHSLAQRLARDAWVLVPDLRNHGRSPHAVPMDYPSMGRDVLGLLDDLGVDSALTVGHSMGGKLAMWLALTEPQRIARLVVVDIAPVENPNRFEHIFAGLQAIDLERLESRAQADAVLAAYVDSAPVRQFLLANLVRQQGRWAWRINLPVLAASIGALTGFPRPAAEQQFHHPSLFIRGGRSSYVTDAHLQRVFELFPAARVETVAGAGHWVYAERPDEFAAILEGFVRQGCD